MRTLVYRFFLMPPTENADRIYAQLRAAFDYRNDLITIEKARRQALRQVDDTEAVNQAVEAVKAATRSTRKAAIKSLREARLTAREAAKEDLARINECDHRLRLDARALTDTWWCTYIGVEAAHNASRSVGIYDEDAVTPRDPKTKQWDDLKPSGKLGVELKHGLQTSEVYEGKNAYARLTRDAANKKYGKLWIRIDSDNRAPVFGGWPIKLHREIPDTAKWKWIHVSLQYEGNRPVWSVEITVEDSALRPRDLDTSLTGAIAIEWEWSPLHDGGLRVARWCDDFGKRGEIQLPARVVSKIRMASKIQTVRDVHRLGDKESGLPSMGERIQRIFLESHEKKPLWLTQEIATIHLWRSPRSFHRLLQRWQNERVDVCREAYEILDAWRMREDHLYQYQTDVRLGGLRRRRDIYRNIAAQLSRQYETVLLSNQNLSLEARFGDEGEARFLAGCYSLKDSLRNAFGDEAIDAKWRDEPKEDDERDWCERAIAVWIAEGARNETMFPKRKEKVTNAWSARRAKAAAKKTKTEAAREAVGNTAE